MKIGTSTAIPLYLNSEFPSVDARQFNNGEPWTSIEEVLSTIPMISRARYLPVNIMGVEYWFKADLISLELVHSFAGLVLDMPFEFRDITPGTVQEYILDIKCTFGYKIISAIMQTDEGELYPCVYNNNVAVVGIAGFWVAPTIGEVFSTPNNNEIVLPGSVVKLVVEATYTGAPTTIRGKLNIMLT